MTTTPPIYLDPSQTFNVILTRMMDTFPDSEDKSQGGFLWDLESPAAIELAQMVYTLRLLLIRSFIGTSYSGYLDLVCQQHGIYRLQPTNAVALVRFFGPPGTVVPPNTQASSIAVTGTPAQQFTNIFGGVVPAGGTFVDITMVAANAGSIGNVPANSIVSLSTQITGVTAITNILPATDGTDLETDDLFRARAIIIVSTPRAGGNKAQYISWALSVDGVGNVSVIPVRDGAGTVSVAILDTNYLPASLDIVNAVQDYIAPNYRILDQASAMVPTISGGTIVTANTDVQFAYNWAGDSVFTDPLYTTSGALNLLKQPGLWNAVVALWVATPTGSYGNTSSALTGQGSVPLFVVGVYNNTAGQWCNTTVTGLTKAVIIYSAQLLATVPNQTVKVPFYWNGSDLIEFRAIRINSGTLPSPAAPTLTGTTGGSLGGLLAPPAPSLAAGVGTLAAQTVWVKTAYVNQYGVSVASAASSLALSVNNSLIITSPPASGTGPTIAVGWYAYVGVGVGQPADTAKWLQQSLGAPTAIGTNLTIASSILNTGTSAAAAIGSTSTYNYRISALNALGETIPGPEAVSINLSSPNNAVIVSWPYLTGATSYGIYGRSPGAESLLAIVNAITLGSSPSWADTGALTPSISMPTINNTVLLPGPQAPYLQYSTSGGTFPPATYFYRITAITPAGETTPSPEVTVPTAGTTSSIQVSWSSSPGATGYKIYRSLGTNTERLVATLTYYISQGITLTAITGGPSFTSTGLLTSWTDANSAVPGALYPGGNTSLPPAGINAPGTVTFTASSTGGLLLSNTGYSYRVTATNVGGETLPTAISAYGNAAIAFGPNTGSISIFWSAVAGATGYKIYGRTLNQERLISTWNGTVWSPGGGAGSTATQFVDTGINPPISTSLLPIANVSNPSINAPGAPTFTVPSTTGGGLTGNQLYYYKVTAINAVGETDASSVSTYTPPAGTNTNQITINWVQVTGATGYRIYRGTILGQEILVAIIVSGATLLWQDTLNTPPPPNIDTSSPTILSPNASAFNNPISVGGFLQSGRTYYYQITALEGPGETLPGVESVYTVPAGGPNTNSILLSWPAVTGATGYRIYRGLTPGSEILAATVGTVTTWTDNTFIATSIVSQANTTGFPDTTNVVHLQNVTYSSKFSKIRGEAQAPIGANVTVESASSVVVNIYAQINVDSVNYIVASVQSSVIEAIQIYLQGQAFALNNSILFSKMVSVISNVLGVININAQTMTMNGTNADILVGLQQVAVLGAVTFGPPF